MHEYDTVLKALLQSSQNSIFEQITGAKVGRWLNVELPEVQQTRVDLLCETAELIRKLIALELQSTNDPLLPLRMAEYSLRVYRIYGQFPQQYVLYVGNQEMRMPSQLEGPNHVCRYQIIDIRNIDAETLLNSPFDADNILAILARYKDRTETIRRILAKIATLESGKRELAFSKLTILSGLRRLEDSVHKEAQYMPIMHDIMDHGIIGPAIRQGLEKGRQEGELTILRRLIDKRFGPLPAWVEERLTTLPLASLEDLSLRILDAKNLDQLFNR